MFATCHGKKIHYEVAGDGFPLILLNGIMMSTNSWTPFVDVFAAQHKLIRMDFFDQGKSDKMETAYDHSIQVDAIFAVMDALGLEQADLVGISYGAQVALQAAVRAPSRIRRMVIANASGKTSDWLAEIGHGWNEVAGNGQAYYYATIPMIYSSQFYGSRLDWMARRKALLIQVFSDPVFAASMVRLTDSSEHYDIENKLGTITIPTLILGSDTDAITPLFEQQKLAAAIPGAELVIMPGVGHASMYEKPALFSSLVLGHLAHDQRTFAV